MSNFWKRTLFGAIFITIVISSVLISEKSLLALLLLINILGLWELYGLCEKDGIFPQKIAGIVLGACPFIIVLSSSHQNDFLLKGLYVFIFTLPFLIFFFELFRKKDKPFANIALTLFGVLYISITLFIFYLISIYPLQEDFILGSYKPHYLLGYFFILWSYDSGAYLAGSQFGKHKLWERVSPKKSWEGVIGGAILALVIAYIISFHFGGLSRTNWIIITFIIIVTGTLGDLVKSVFKRSIDVKDSGNIIPGHGGIIDRFDALFLSAPFVLCYLYLSN